MYYKSKIKRIPAILSSIAITFGSISLNSFAMINSEESINSEGSIGVSTSIVDLIKQDTNTSIGVSNVSTNQEKPIEKSKHKIITISEPGDYRLVGLGMGISNSNNPNEIVVNCKDSIKIKGPGIFDIILDNVNIDVNNEFRHYMLTMLTIERGANVNLILEGKNTLQGKWPDKGIYVDERSNLIITEGSKGSSLDVEDSIKGTNVTIESGTIVSGEIKVGEQLIIDGGEIHTQDLEGKNIIIDGGRLVASRLKGKDININDGVATINQLEGENLNIDGGKVCAYDVYIDKLLEINGGDIKGEKIIIGEKIEINSGIINTFEVSGMSDDNQLEMIMNGGELHVTPRLLHLSSYEENYESKDYGINATVVTINGGKIDPCRIYADKLLEINNISCKGEAIVSSDNMIIRNSILDIDYLFSKDKLNIEGGKVHTRCSMKAGTFTINGGTEIRSKSLEADNSFEINDATVEAVGIYSDKLLEINNSNILGPRLNSRQVGGLIKSNNITIKNSNVNIGGVHAKNQLNIEGVQIPSPSCILGFNININNSELLVAKMNAEIFNHEVIGRMEKVFGKFNDKDELVACCKNAAGEDYRFIGYLLKSDNPDPKICGKYVFIGSEAIINGTKIVEKDSDEGNYRMKDGNNFVSESSRNNYNDLELFFE